jgi:oxalate decarboxylase/phosphoglucose isomerase-like protein (cupin superfamily)
MQKIGSCFISTENDVDKLQFDWGVIHILAREKMTGSKTFSFGHVVLQPGKGHVRHNHPGADEVIYVLSGEGDQMLDDQPAVRVKPGDCIWIPKDVYHSTINQGSEPMILLVVYSPAGAEDALWQDPNVQITAPES